MVPTTTVAASLQGRYEGESSLDFSRSLTLLTVSNRRKVSPTLNRVAMHWAATEDKSLVHYTAPILSILGLDTIVMPRLLPMRCLVGGPGDPPVTWAMSWVTSTF